MPGQIYDDLDPMYRAIWGESLHHGFWITGNEGTEEAKENLIQEILKHGQFHGHIADIGCGYGTLAHRLIRNFNCLVTACTSSQVQAEAISPSENLTILSGHWLDQKFTPQSFDAAIALESISHFADFEALLEKNHQALKPGAPWIICDWFSDHGGSPLLAHLAKTGDLPPWRSLDSFLSLARRQGFEVSFTDDLSQKVAQTWTSLLKKALFLPFKSPKLIPTLFLSILKRPALLWTFPLLRLAYQRGDLSYHLIKLTQRESLSSRPQR